MGGDGGSIPKRADMIKTKGYSAKRDLGGMGYLPNTIVWRGEDSLSNVQNLDLLLSTCALTQQPLQKPVVIDRKGHLIDKSGLIEALIKRKSDAAELPQHLIHIKSLKKDTRTIDDSKFRDAKDMGVNRVFTDSPLLWCPIKECYITGSAPGVFFWNCGCVVSISGWASLLSVTVKSIEKKNLLREGDCPSCSKPYKPSDVIRIGYLPDKVDALNLFSKTSTTDIPSNTTTIVDNKDVTDEIIINATPNTKRLRCMDIEMG